MRGGGGLRSEAAEGPRCSADDWRRKEKIKRGNPSPTRYCSPERKEKAGGRPQERGPVSSCSLVKAIGGCRSTMDRNLAVDAHEGMAAFGNTSSVRDKSVVPLPGSDKNRSSGSRARPGSQTLVWVRKDLLQTRSFTAADCHPAGVGFLPKPKIIKFSELWGVEAGRRSYAEILKMAGGGRGSGRTGGAGGGRG
jgi:hypothetical protein